jgi:DNA repair protein RadC
MKMLKLKLESVDSIHFKDIVINSPEDVVECVRDYMSGLSSEEVIALYLGMDNSPIGVTLVSKGSIEGSSEFSPKDVLAPAVLCNATKLVLVHNHPTGNLDISEADIHLTQVIASASPFLAIELSDHIIVDTFVDNFVSIRDEMSYLF